MTSTQVAEVTTVVDKNLNWQNVNLPDIENWLNLNEPTAEPTETEPTTTTTTTTSTTTTTTPVTPTEPGSNSSNSLIVSSFVMVAICVSSVLDIM